MSSYSEHKFTHALVRPPSANFADGVTEANLGAPDFELAINQHAAYCAALQECGLELLVLPSEPMFPDACFVEDTAVIIGESVVINRLGHPTRQGEESTVRQALTDTKSILHIKEPGSVDGGDIMRVGDHFFIGLSQRTNKAGADQLAAHIEAAGKTYTMVPVENFIHLKTFMSAIDKNTIIGMRNCVPSLVEQAVENALLVPDEEHWAANCVSANGFVIVPADCPEAERQLHKVGKEVIVVNVSEFQKMDGRLTCLSILF